MKAIGRYSRRRNPTMAALALSACAAPWILGQTQTPTRTTEGASKAQPPQPKIPGTVGAAKASNKSPSKEFFIHAFHAEKLGGLECSMCHVAVKEGSVILKRPGHEQCMPCHGPAFGEAIDKSQLICAQCHNQFPPNGAADLVPFPRYKNTRAILFEFSHAKHVDQKGRINAATGFRADCTFCHTFQSNGIYATFPTHTECAACHAKTAIKPNLSPALDAQGCRGCHTPEEVENPGFTERRRMIAPHVVSGKYMNINFSHIAHFKAKEEYGINCTTCHYAIPRSTGLADLTLPRMLDCVECHDTSKKIQAQFRMSNCRTCHSDTATGFVTPASHTRNVKPAFHTESFRVHHEQEATAADAKCFVCHQNVTPSIEAKNQCISCHQVMEPASHTARWKDDIHGKYAALERTNCATCHTTDYCSRCHNELPRSHVPLPLFKAGAHARVAMLDQRACMTCHTFQNTCAECHTRGLSAAPAKR